MAEINWGLRGPGFDAMQVLQAAGQTYPQQMQREEQQYQRQRDTVQDEQRQAQIDRQYLDKLTAEQKAQARADFEELGQIALLAKDPVSWDQQVDLYAQRHPEALKYKGQFSPQLRQSIIAQTGLAKEYLAMNKPDWRVVPEGGYLQDVNPVTSGGQPTAPQPREAPQAAARSGADLEAAAAAAIAAGADPAAVRARMAQMQGGAGSQAPRSFP